MYDAWVTASGNVYICVDTSGIHACVSVLCASLHTHVASRSG
jgi:hypothetical protein